MAATSSRRLKQPGGTAVDETWRMDRTCGTLDELFSNRNRDASYFHSNTRI
ncbi:MAG: hypothetical protein L3J03_12205 [Desulfobacterales bacterium]|nr:hypothetical protein [Desulfobacterales bacterium]